ncbi:hypothetical protein PB2503_08044 [Parvularcula bermudensis HTCC2503]|uniref:DUF2336 domain-containing protein n=1 Tax=Parvularcula bermudensis (strain ATCC BAA-594 / HTCC2503 / KCTC 12087) TaxID=314260 RepID=E0TH80_PARBH|nr:hypothetical protein [Parvularcula bermudensis]ADM09664.1 hypothetical protein PB2503_08044 [Parvularcula bermudensis HTCC2503]
MSTHALQRLIAFDTLGGSQDRRRMLRDVTEKFMVCEDRYGRRNTSLFDLLLSRTASAMDRKSRRMIVALLAKAGMDEKEARNLIIGLNSPNRRFLRGTVTRPIGDLFLYFKEAADPGDLDPNIPLKEGHSLHLPEPMPDWLFQCQVTFFLKQLTPQIGEDRAQFLRKAFDKLRSDVVKAACDAGREEIILARRKIKEWTRVRPVDDDLLLELLGARAMTEFIFAGMEFFDVDAATMFRILNDRSFDCFAIACRARDVRRSVFAEALTRFNARDTDDLLEEPILHTYDQLPRETAERVMRFWQIRVKEEINKESLETAIAS